MKIDFSKIKDGVYGEKLVYEYFEDNAKAYPDRTALIFHGESITYKEVNERANRLANMLAEKGVKPDDFVGILVERSFEMIISILAVLKTGAAYLPIDPRHPIDRRKYYLENSKADFLITFKKYINDDDSLDVKLIFWDDEESWNNYSTDNLKRKASQENVAYIIYTSGSTGTPKGVMIRHNSLLNRLCWMIENFNFNEDDVFLQKTTYAFDVSIWELLCWGMVGAKLSILDPGKEKNPRNIVKNIENNNVTVLHFVPSVLELFIEYTSYKFDLDRIKSLKYVVVSGEALSVKTTVTFNKLYRTHHDMELWNLYGPTEAAIDVTSYNCNNVDESFKTVPIGKAVWNTELYVLDENLNKVAQGEEGELYIGGIQVAKGYCNNEELTKKSFIKDPFVEDGIMYKTGDLVSLNKDSQIEYHGRIDFQVKLRGLRIELGEIESHIESFEGVKKSVVIVDEHDAINKYLVAFYTGEVEVNEEEMVKFLNTKMPEYMIPSKYIHIDNFETTLNGKLDKKALKKVYEEKYC